MIRSVDLDPTVTVSITCSYHCLPESPPAYAGHFALASPNFDGLLQCSGPTRRGIQQVNLRGFELLSDCVVELIARAYCGNYKVIATAIDAGQKTLSGVRVGGGVGGKTHEVAGKFCGCRVSESGASLAKQLMGSAGR